MDFFNRNDRKIYYVVLLIFLSCVCHVVESSAQVLIIQDELPQMEVLTNFLNEKGLLDVKIVDQASMPADLSGFDAIIVYIHRKLAQNTEQAIIDYTKNGGRFICLHHSISSGKAHNEFYFDFLGIQLDDTKNSKNPVEPGGGYGWRHDVTLTLINLNPNHYITNHQVEWNDKVSYMPSDQPSVEQEYPAIQLHDSEVYLNHKFTDGREKTVLIGIKYFDDRNGKLFMQDRGAWIKQQGQGEVIYFAPGHEKNDFENQNFSQIILNAINWKLN